MIPALIRGSRLAYPGTRPGFDNRHPASKGISVGKGISVIAYPANKTDAGWINIVDSRRGTPGASNSGKVQAGSISGIGPAAGFNVGNTAALNWIWTPQTGAAGVATAAAIFVPQVTPGFYSQLVNWNNNSAAIAINGSLAFEAFVASGADNGTAVNGTPYFFAACIKAASINSVVVNLQTGQTTAQSFAGQSSTIGTNISICGAPSGAQSFAGYMAAAMCSTANLSLTQLIQWGADPWSFWYPGGEFETLNWLSAPAANFPVGSPMYYV